MNIGEFKARNYELVKKEIERVVKVSKLEGKKLRKEIVVKVLIETGF